MRARLTDPLWLRLIAAFKLVKAFTLLLAGVAAQKLLDPAAGAAVASWAASLNPDRHHLLVDLLLRPVLAFEPQTLRLLSVGSFLYAALFAAEGAGLFLGQRWAEWMTVVTTAGLLPIEIYEIARHANATRVLALLANVAVVVYLAVRLRAESRHDLTLPTETSARAVP